MTAPISPDEAFVQRRWQVALEPGPGCLPVERLGDTLSAPEQSHVAACVRCQTEQAMLQEFEASRPEADEGAAVAWIVAETRRRRAVDVPIASPSRARVLPRWALMAASIAVVVGAAAVVRRPAPVVDDAVAQGTYRASRVEVVGPVGDVERFPQRFTWEAVAGAVEYEVRLVEVDGTAVWSVMASTPSVVVPDAVRAVALPGKAMNWTVVAKGADGRVLAESGRIGFRVRPPL